MTHFNLATRLASLLAMGLAAASAHAQTFSGGPFALTDASVVAGMTVPGVAFGNIVVSGHPGALISSFNSVTITNFTHSWIGDIEVDLINVDTGATVILTSPPDATNANFNGNYTFLVNTGLQTIDEVAFGQPTTFDVPTGSYAISDYGGGAANGTRTDYSAVTSIPLDGTWRLQVTDFAAGDTGAIGGWNFNVTTVVPEPGSAALFGLALLPGLALLRRRATS